MEPLFKTTTYAKCILAGEHAVLRHYTLLAKSIKSYQLELEYVDKNDFLIELHYPHSSDKVLEKLFNNLMARACQLISKNMNSVRGHFVLRSNIPLSAGLGFSAAICVAVTNWMIFRGWILESQKFEFAKALEDMFHGESSGADIAACLSEDVIIYKKQQAVFTIHPVWKPHIYIQQSNIKSVTFDAIQKVLKIHQEQPQVAKTLDEKMNQATFMIIDALQNSSNHAIHLLEYAFNQANECFEAWGLIPAEMSQQISLLKEQGAIAVKPTGAGNGGSLLSLWKEEPVEKIKKQLIPVF